MSVIESQTPAEAGQIVFVAPRTLVLEVNVRAEANLTPEFVGSIKTHGVLAPVLVQRTADVLHVRAGQRRALASIEAGLTAIPAYVVDGDTDEARRIIEQMAENDHRTALADHDRVAALQHSCPCSACRRRRSPSAPTPRRTRSPPPSRSRGLRSPPR
jgi:ParB family chromosome partitioning protein